MIQRKNKLVSTETNNENTLEKKHIEYLIKSCAIIKSQCDKKELKVSELKFQPLYSTVLNEIKTQLEFILRVNENLDTICNNEYLLITKNEMYLSFTEFSGFVHEEAATIGHTQAISRKKFFNYIVHFKFLALEISAYFPSGVYNPTNVVITKEDSKNWWQKHFPDKIFVLRRDFMEKLRRNFSFNNEAEAKSFENCLDFTKTRYVTTFEFDIITRLYFPLNQFIIIWSIIYNHPGYLHFGTYEETIDILNEHISKPGTYVFRASCKEPGCWTIGWVKDKTKDKTSDIGQLKIGTSSLINALIDGREKKEYLYPNGKDDNPDLSLYRTKHKEVHINSEELELYASFNEYKECKICRENEKDIEIESCGHEICEICFNALIHHSRKTCPFCNQFMKSYTKIVHKINDNKVDGYVGPNAKKVPEVPTRPKPNGEVQNKKRLTASSVLNQNDEENDETELNENKSSSSTAANASSANSKHAQVLRPVFSNPSSLRSYPSTTPKSPAIVSYRASDFNGTATGHNSTSFEEDISEQPSCLNLDKRFFNTAERPNTNQFKKKPLHAESKAPKVPPFPINKTMDSASDYYYDAFDKRDVNTPFKIDSKGFKSNLNGTSDSFSKWSKPEVDKAMRIAQGNKEIALNILKEYH